MTLMDMERLTNMAMGVKGATAAIGDPMMSMLIIDAAGELTMVPWPHNTMELERCAEHLRILNIKEAAFIGDAYGENPVGESALRQRVRGELERRFLAGDPDVYEVLFVYHVTRDGRVSMNEVRYEMVGGLPIYADTKQHTNGTDAEGVIPDALRRLVGVR